MKARGKRWPLKTKKSRWLVAILAGAPLLIWIYLSRGIHSGFVPYIPLNVHSSADRWLSVDGRFFMHPQGEPPYCLEVKPINCVFFVLNDRQRNSFAHFLNRESGIDVIVPLHDLVGYGIGTGINSNTHDWVDSAKWPNVTIYSRHFQDIDRYDFNLEKKTVVHSVVFRGPH